MRKKVGIWILIISILFIFMFVFLYRISYHIALSELEEERKEQLENLQDCYYLGEEDGYVTVYYADEETVYEYTSIPIKTLPIRVQMELDEGKRVDTLSQVYGFLENYSS